MAGPRGIFCTGTEFVWSFAQYLQSSCHNTPETEIPSEGRDLSWQRKRNVETDRNTNFYFSGGLCLTSECVKLKPAGKTRKDTSLLKAFCLHSAPHTSSQMPALLGDQQPEMLLLPEWCQYSELLQRQIPCLLALCILHVQAHLPDSFVFPPLLF